MDAGVMVASLHAFFARTAGISLAISLDLTWSTCTPPSGVETPLAMLYTAAAPEYATPTSQLGSESSTAMKSHGPITVCMYLRIESHLITVSLNVTCGMGTNIEMYCDS